MQRDVSDLQSELQKIRNPAAQRERCVSRSVSHSFMSHAAEDENAKPTLWRLDYVPASGEAPARLATRSTQLMVLSSRPR